MTIVFACESCGQPGKADRSHIGRRVRCKGCGHVFTIHDPDGPPPADVYRLDAMEDQSASDSTGEPVSTFAPAPVEKTVLTKPKRRKTVSTSAPRRQDREREESPGSVKIWIGVAIVGVAVLAGVATLVPGGTLIVAGFLSVIGSILVLYGYATGAYIAFTEDSLHGLLYLLIPFYTGYYIMSRWDDMASRFAYMTAGGLLVIVAGWIAPLSPDWGKATGEPQPDVPLTTDTRSIPAGFRALLLES